MAHYVLCAAWEGGEDERLMVIPLLSAPATSVPGMRNECEPECCGHPCRYGIVVRVGFMFDECKARRKWH